MIDRRLSNSQLEKILGCFWEFETAKNAAAIAGASPPTMDNFWNKKILKRYYESERLPKNLPLESVFDGDKPLSIGEIYQKALRNSENVRQK